MKNDRGFTLIELLVTIALISAVSIVIGVNILNMNKRQEAKNIEQFKKKVEDAACTYADIKGITQTSETTYISTYCLIKDGYLKETPIPGGNDKLGNSEGGKNYKIEIEWKNDSEKVCTYTTETGNTDCPNDAVNEPEPDPTPDPTSTPDPDPTPGDNTSPTEPGSYAVYWNDSFKSNDYLFPSKPGTVYNSPNDIPNIGTDPIYVKTDNNTHWACLRYNNKDFCVNVSYWVYGETVTQTMNRLKADMEEAFGVSASNCTTSSIAKTAQCTFGNRFDCSVNYNMSSVNCGKSNGKACTVQKYASASGSGILAFCYSD